MNKTAVGIACWNRPDYFKLLISSIEANLDDLGDVDTHLFLDGDICYFTGERRTEKKLILENINTFQKALIPNKTIHIRSLNVSIAIHQYEMMQMLASNYEQIIFLEDDVIVSPNFIGIMKKLLSQFKNDDSVFSISPGFKLMCKKEEIDQYKNILKFSEGHFWAEAMWTKKWNQMLPRYKKYIDIISEKAYKNRDNQRIMSLFKNHGRIMPATSQDNAKDWAISLTGMKRTRLMVNRATGIGDIGVHSTPEKLKHSGDGHNAIQIFDNEKQFDYKIT